MPSPDVPPVPATLAELLGEADALPPDERMTHFVHAARTRELRRLPGGARVVLSGGANADWYFDWFAASYPTPVERHIGVEFYLPVPEALPPGVEWLQRTLGDLGPVDDGSVDLAFAGQVIEHLWPHELAGFLAEAHRVLRTGGTLCVDSVNRRVTLGIGWWYGEHTVELTPGEMRDLLLLAGFTGVEVRGVWLCARPGGGAFMPLEIDAGGPEWPWRRRMEEAGPHPDDAFIWWITARRGEGAFPREAVEARVRELYRAARPHYVARRLVPDGALAEAGLARRADGGAGPLVHGPYMAMPPGGAAVRFRLCRPAGPATDPGLPVARVDVTCEGEPLAERVVTAGMLAADGTDTAVDLDAWFPQTSFGVEFRVWSLGTLPVAARLPVEVREGLGPGQSAATAQAEQDQLAALRADRDRLAGVVAQLTGSASWRASAPVRRLAAGARRRLHRRG